MNVCPNPNSKEEYLRVSKVISLN
jgi:hypothetical protein